MMGILPFQMPMVGSYPSFCCPFGIAQAADSDALTWLVVNSMIHSVYYDEASNEIKSNLVCQYNPWGLRFAYDSCPMFRTRRVSRDFLDYKKMSIDDLIRWSIDSNRYVHLDINVAKIGVYGLQANLCIHNVFFYGYSGSEFVFCDFIGENGFQSYRCGRDELLQAYSTYIAPKNWRTGFEDIITIGVEKPSYNRREYPKEVYEDQNRLCFDVHENIGVILGYSQPFYAACNPNQSVGIRAYEAIIRYLMSIIKDNDHSEHTIWAMTTLGSFLQDHKTVMTYLFSNLIGNSQMGMTYSSLYLMSRKVVYHLLRFLQKTSPKDIEESICILQDMRRIEENALICFWENQTKGVFR